MVTDDDIAEIVEDQPAKPAAPAGAVWAPAKRFGEEVAALHGNALRSGVTRLSEPALLDIVFRIANEKAESSELFELATGLPIGAEEARPMINKHSGFLLRGLPAVRDRLRGYLIRIRHGAARERVQIRREVTTNLFGRVITVPVFEHMSKKIERESIVIPIGLNAACDFAIALLSSGAGAKEWPVGRCEIADCGLFFIAGRHTSSRRRRSYCGDEHMMAAHTSRSSIRKKASREKRSLRGKK